MARPAKAPSAASRLLGALVALLGLALYSVWVALVVVVPLLAAWVASSVAAHAGGSIRVAAASGLLLFPALPVLWELLGAWRRSRAAKPSKRFLTLTDRLVLRTLAVSVLFLGAVLARDPTRVFVSLNGRGDWMLDGRHDARSETARRWLFRLAARTVGLLRLVDDNPFHSHGRGPRPQPLPRADVSVTSTGAQDTTPAPEPPHDPHAWPFDDAALHPAVRSLGAADELSPESVGRYLAAHEADAWGLTRAVHDYVADRVAYDVDAYRSGVYPPQDSETTFRTRRSVCAGYAALFTAVGRAAGLTVETVVGRARGYVAEGMGEGHAWNAVQLGGAWRLVDTTWDAGYVGTDGFHKRFRTAYLLAPPEVFGSRHFPDEARWQLLATPRTPGEYLRTPTLDPEFFADGLRLVSPDRAESDAHGSVEVVLENPRRFAMIVSVRAQGGEQQHCALSGGTRITARCALTGSDLHEVLLFAGTQRHGQLWSVGSLRVHNR